MKKEKINSKVLDSIINRTLSTDLNSLLQYPVDIDDEDFFEKTSKYAFAEYEHYLFADAIDFHKLNNIYFDYPALLKIKQFFMDDLDKKGASRAVKKEVEEGIDAYIANYKIEGEPRKELPADLNDVNDLYYYCYILVRAAAPRKSRTKKTEDDYYEEFVNKWNKIYDSNLVDKESMKDCELYHLIFQVSLKCYAEGGNWDIIEDLEHTCCDSVSKIRRKSNNIVVIY